MDELEIKEKIEEIVVNGETVYIKKDALGWHVCNPIKNKDGSINWKNLLTGGSYIKLILIIGFVIICVAAMFEVSHIVNVANECLNKTQVINWNLK